AQGRSRDRTMGNTARHLMTTSDSRVIHRRAHRKLSALVFVALLSLGIQPASRAQNGDALPFSKAYSVTGNYVVGAVDLAPQSGGGGFLTGTIPMNGVPANADIL